MTSLSNTFVCVMGMGTVFIGLICIVLICKLLSLVLRLVEKTDNASNSMAATTASTVAANAAAPQMNLAPAEKSAVVAGICACIAEELGTEASNIKVVSFKRV